MLPDLPPRAFSEPSTTKGTLIFLGTRRTHHPTLQVTIVGPPGSRCSLSRGETESLVATSRRHLQDPTLHYAFPHTCSCHQHVTAWTSTRLSWHDYIDDIWSVTSGCRSARTPVFDRFASVQVLEASVIFRKAFDLPPHSFPPLERFRSYELAADYYAYSGMNFQTVTYTEYPLPVEQVNR